MEALFQNYFEFVKHAYYKQSQKPWYIKIMAIYVVVKVFRNYNLIENFWI